MLQDALVNNLIEWEMDDSVVMRNYRVALFLFCQSGQVTR